LQQSLLEQARQRLAVGSMSQSNLETIDCGLISVIGSGFWQSPETLDTVRKITPDALFFDVKNSCLTLAVSPEKVERVVKSLHNSLIS
jgi:hypothetical protein